MFPLPELVAQAGPFGGADLAQQRGTVAELAQICQTWGAILAAMHTTATHGPSPLAARPWVINPEHRPASMRPCYRLMSPRMSCGAPAREVDERWTELHWIYGNLTATNVLVEHQPALRVSFIDPCGVGLGDPAWIWPQPWT
jgi:Ser/Thr protein kinase RdoA (MazF antagonist)